jgi:hypothetical protein
MAINPPADNLPLADVLRAANELVAAGLIEDWALGGALAAIYYVEPFTTYAADIFFYPQRQGIDRRNSCHLRASPSARLAGRTRTFFDPRISRSIPRRRRFDRLSCARGGEI